MKTALRELVFFLLVALCFLFAIQSSHHFTPSAMMTTVSVLIFTCLVVLSYRLLEPYRKEGFTARMCRGGPYMYSGEGWFSQMCRRLAETVEGRAEIDKYNCKKGYNGLPKEFPKYSSHSDSNWKGIQCDGI